MKCISLYLCCKNKKRNYLDKQEMLYKKSTEYDNECAICLEKLHNRSCIFMDNCKHIYHYDCIENYIENLNNSCKNEFHCPLCMSKQDKIYNSIKNIIK